MTNYKVIETNALTGETIEREMTNAEQAERNAFLAEVEAETQAKSAEAEAKAQAKATAEGKLAALGLTTDDLRALGL
jgi:hypothetical protein